MNIRSGQPAVHLEDVIKVYREVDVETIALRGVDLEVPHGQFVAIEGRSGSGKSTLLNLIAGMDRPTAGRIWLEGTDIARVPDAVRHQLRHGTLGIVFQANNLVAQLDLRENLALAAALGGAVITSEEALGLIELVGLSGRADHRPSQLSGGEQQRAALACVLAGRPRLLLADEITGELDSTNAKLVLDLLRAIHERGSLTLIMVTHDAAVAAWADRIVQVKDGAVASDRLT